MLPVFVTRSCFNSPCLGCEILPSRSALFVRCVFSCFSPAFCSVCPQPPWQPLKAAAKPLFCREAKTDCLKSGLNSFFSFPFLFFTLDRNGEREGEGEAEGDGGKRSAALFFPLSGGAREQAKNSLSDSLTESDFANQKYTTGPAFA